jgi:hypothetical protein
MSASVIGLTVLVVEDDWLLRQQIVSELQDAEWTALEAATAAGDGAMLLPPFSASVAPELITVPPRIPSRPLPETILKVIGANRGR